MIISYTSRKLYPDELRVLRTLETRLRKEGGVKIKYDHFLLATLLGIALLYLTSITHDTLFGSIFGFLSVIPIGFIVFTPYEIYKTKKRNKNLFKQLDLLLLAESVSTCRVTAKRIALAEEYEDEGDLYIIECNDNNILYLWDHEYNLRKKFPCLVFEIYEPNFVALLGRQVYPLSERIKPLIIEKKAKWNYLNKISAPEHLTTEKRNWDQLVNDYQNCV